MMITFLKVLAVGLSATVSEQAVEGIEAPKITAAAVDNSHTVMELVLGAGPVVQLVLIILLLMSIATWGIVITKSLHLRKASLQTKSFSDVFWGSRNFEQIADASVRYKLSPVANVFSAGNRELRHVINDKETKHAIDLSATEIIQRALHKAKSEEVTKLEQGNAFLATTASAAPFIGLFGTVWGIMNAFIGLSNVKSTSIQAVAPGISEALIATAIGLAAAIPAAIAYNYFSQQLRKLNRSMDSFSAEFLNIAKRHFLS